MVYVYICMWVDDQKKKCAAYYHPYTQKFQPIPPTEQCCCWYILWNRTPALLVNVLFHLGFMCNTNPLSTYNFSLTFSLRCSIDFMRKYTINRRTVKEVVNNNNTARRSPRFIHVLYPKKLKIGTHTPKQHSEIKKWKKKTENKITKCKCTTVPIKFNKLISEIQVLRWSINHRFYRQHKNIG